MRTICADYGSQPQFVQSLSHNIFRFFSQSSTADEDARLFGLDLGGSARSDVFIVVPEAWDAVRLFVACATQWRIGPSGRLLGLDYRAARAAARGLGIRWKAVFGDLRIMEGEALDAQSESK